MAYMIAIHETRASCLEPCATEDGNLVGRDPRQMGRAGLEAAGRP
jgi:hypothetical protein